MPIPSGVVAPLLLAAVLLLSAVAKWKEPGSTQSAITLLRLPRFLQNRTIARALPIGEGILALAMLAPWSPLVKVAAIAAGALFVAYAVIVARALTFDPRPSCGCFGRIGDQRIVPKTLVRNILLVAAAAVLAWFAFADQTVPATLLSMGSTGWAWLAMGTLLAAIGVLVLGGSATAAHSHPHPQPSPDDSAFSMTPVSPDGVEDDDEYIRGPIPQALLLDPQGEPHTLTEMARQRAQLLIFMNCYCGSTHQAFRSAQQWRDRLPQIDVRMVFSGVPVMQSTGDVDTVGSWTDHASLTWQKLELRQSPSALLLGADGLLAGGPVSGNEELDAFLEEIGEALAEAPMPEDGPASDAQVTSEVVQTH